MVITLEGEILGMIAELSCELLPAPDDVMGLDGRLGPPGRLNVDVDNIELSLLRVGAVACGGVVDVDCVVREDLVAGEVIIGNEGNVVIVDAMAGGGVAAVD